MKHRVISPDDPKPKQKDSNNKPVTNTEEAVTNKSAEACEDELFHEQAGENPVGYEGENEKGKVTNADEMHELDDMLHGNKEEEEEL